MAVLRRRIRCHGCNQQSREAFSRVPPQYRCLHCDAMNYFDQAGNITDPPLEAVVNAPNLSFQHALSRSPSPVMSFHEEPRFCNTCVRNQNIVKNLVAEYLPDDDDPDYDTYDAAYSGWREEIEERYPPVCQECKERVAAQIRSAGYAAKTDHLRRIMEKSEKKRRTVPTSRQTWTLRLIAIFKWVYIGGFLMQVLWHIWGCMMDPSETMGSDIDVLATDGSILDICMRQAVLTRSVDQACVLSSSVLDVLLYALVADGLTIWWNPRLKDKTNSITGRMQGLRLLWATRVATFVLRGLSLFHWKQTPVDIDNVVLFKRMHVFMLVILAMSFGLTWKAVRITHHAPVAIRRSVEPASAPTSPAKSRTQTGQSAHPRATAFDTMAQGFTSSFLDGKPSAAYPPSPTLTATSSATHATEATTPFGPKSVRGDDDMDWTPTQRRFAQHQPTVHPSPWRESQEPSSPQYTTSREPHSLFSQPDPNPFRHRVPAAPKAPAEVKVDPWKRPAWAPPVKDAQPNFFEKERKARGDVGEMKGLDGFGVPKNVKRDAELFASPQLKYDYYGTMKDTGLEDSFESTFNSLFAK